MFKYLREKYEYYGLYLYIIVFMLVIIGNISVFSSSNYLALVKNNNIMHYFIRQLVFSIIGLSIAFIFANINKNIGKIHLYDIYIFVLILMVLVLFIGVGDDEVGARSWIRIGGFGIQPSELGKIAMVMMFATFLEKYHNKDKYTDKKMLFINLALTLVPVILVLLEPDMGTAFIMCIALFIMLFFTRIKLIYFINFIAIGAVGFLLLIGKAAYRAGRIKAFINPWSDPLGLGYHIIQSYYAIVNGGLFGVGIGNSTQKYLWLPEAHTDFIFSVIIEETGILGASLILILLLLFMFIIFEMSKKVNNYFAYYSIIGLSSLILFQSFLNIMVATGLFPITGVTLPFISYGGSSMISSCILIGFIINIYQTSIE